ncbi:hypothetical protein K1719_004642 [Acacia pycnantha]|nr:hypothetical protein K1719_004642 [Acacia pycnantha]
MTSIGSKLFDKSHLREIPLLKSGMLKNDFGDMCDKHYGFQTEVGKSADARIMRLLEFFRHLYYRRSETFQKIVPSELQEEFVELFDRIEAVFSGIKSKNKKANTIQRSLSLGQRSLAAGGSDLRLDRFKIRTVRVDNDNVGDKSDNTTNGGKDVKGR